MRIFGPKELLEDVHAKELCIDCGACVSLCPYFKSHKGKTAMLFPCTLSQGRCYAYCPKTEVDLNRLFLGMWDTPYAGDSLGVYENILASRSRERRQGVYYQAGGTVSALISFALKEKIIDAAVLTDRQGLIPVPRVVTDPAEVASCAGSKFMASPTLAALNKGIWKGFVRIGVVGTPCQMMAVSQMRSNPLSRHDFQDPIALSIGLFCNWSLSSRRLMAYLQDRTDIERLRGMEIPPPPANTLVLKRDDGEQEFDLSDIKPLIPDSCFICPDMTSEFADISVGIDESKPGWNTLVVRSKRGANLIDQVLERGVLEASDIHHGQIEHLSAAAAAKKERALRMLVRRDLLNTNADSKRSAMRIPEEVVRKILGGEDDCHV